MKIEFRKLIPYEYCKHKDESIILIGMEKYCSSCASKLDYFGTKVIKPKILIKGLENLFK